MALVAKTGGSNKQKDMGRVEEGTHPARIVQVIDLGTQIQTDWKSGEVLTYEDSGDVITKKEVMVTFEFPNETIEIGGEEKPRWLSKRYTNSLHEMASLTKLVKAVEPKFKGSQYDLTDLLEKPVMATVGTTSGGKAKITGTTSVPKGFDVPELQNEAKVFGMDDPDQEVFDSLPNFLQEMINKSLERTPGESFAGNDPDEDTPF